MRAFDTECKAEKGRVPIICPRPVAEKGYRKMARALWVCRNCNFSWWTDGKSLMEIIDTTQMKGCPKQCSGVSNQIYISEYERYAAQVVSQSAEIKSFS